MSSYPEGDTAEEIWAKWPKWAVRLLHVPPNGQGQEAIILQALDQGGSRSVAAYYIHASSLVAAAQSLPDATPEAVVSLVLKKLSEAVTDVLALAKKGRPSEEVTAS